MAAAPLIKQFNNPFAALRDRDFLIYWIASAVSSVGIWMHSTALSWLTYRMTDSALMLGVVNAVHFAPYLLFSLFAGVLIDRLPKKSTMIVSHLLCGLISISTFVLIRLDHISLWIVIILAILSGTISVLIIPLRLGYIGEIVPPGRLLNGVALYSTAYNLARIIGPAVGGYLIAWLGIDSAFLTDGLCFLSIPLAMLFIREKKAGATMPSSGQGGFGNVMKMAKSGVGYAMKTPAIRDIVTIIALIGTFAINFSVLLPVAAREILHQEETGFGLLMSTVGIGSSLGAFLVASNSSRGPMRFLIYGSPIVLILLLLCIGLFPGRILLFVCLALIGFFYVACSSTATTALQMHAPPEYTGRIMSIYSLVLAGTSPIGNLFSGTIADAGGVEPAFIACAGGFALCFLLYYLIFRFAKRDATSTPFLPDP